MYPHFQKGPVPASLDKDLKWCHKATPFLDNMILLAPSAEWIKSLLNGKLPERRLHALRQQAASQGRSLQRSGNGQLADDLAQWLERPDVGQVSPI